MVGCETKNKHSKATCWNDIQVHAQKLLTILVNIIEG